MEVVELGHQYDFHDSPQDACDSLDRLLNAATYARMRQTEFLECFSMTEGRYGVLAALKSAGSKGLSQSELANRLMQSESNISTLVEQMQREGFLDRQRIAADRRKWMLMLSPFGQERLQQIEDARRVWVLRLFGRWPSGQIAFPNERLWQRGDSISGIEKEIPDSLSLVCAADSTKKFNTGNALRGESGCKSRGPQVAMNEVQSIPHSNKPSAEDVA